MINSRSTDLLDPEVRTVCLTHLALCSDAGIELLITSTYRDYESQDQLFAIGRTAFPVPGAKPVTNAKGGHSWHNFKCAWDIVPMVQGKPDWVARDSTGKLTPVWAKVIELGKQAGAQSASDWTTFREDAHFQVVATIHGLHINVDEARARFNAAGTIFAEGQA